MQLPRAPCSHGLSRCGWQSWGDPCFLSPSAPRLYSSSVTSMEFLLSQSPAQKLGDFRDPHPASPGSFPALILCSQLISRPRCMGRVSGSPAWLIRPTVPQFLGLIPQALSTRRPSGWNGALGIPVLLHHRRGSQPLPSVDRRAGSLRTPLGTHTSAHTSFSSSCASRSSISAVALCSASEPAMVLSIPASAGQEPWGLYRPGHPPPPCWAPLP